MPEPADLAGLVDTEIGVSAWRVIDQAMIDQFADVTGDHQFIHVDPEAAKATPFGGAIAHGFLVLSLLTGFLEEVGPPLSEGAIGVNYGFDKVRFITPVRSGARVRGRFTLSSMTDRGPGQTMLIYAATVEVEGEDKPALIAEWRALSIAAS